MPGVYFSKTVILGLILLSPRLSGVVLSSSSLRQDGNPNLKGSSSAVQWEAEGNERSPSTLTCPTAGSGSRETSVPEP